MTLVLATNRDWFASALEGVLEAESYRVRRVESVEDLVEWGHPDERLGALVLDAHIAGEETPEVIGRLLAGPLPRDLPVLVYSSGQLDDALYGQLLAAGAWEVVEGPVRSARFIPTLRRFLEISGRGRSRDGGAAEDGSGLPTLEDLLDRLPVVEALAQREQATIAVMAIGPTVSREPEGYRDQWERVADICRFNGLRKSDLCGWLDGGDEFAVVAYSTTREGARVLAERIARLAADRLEAARHQDVLSVGIVELRPEDLPDEIRAEDRAEAQAEILARARRALDEARREGGGVRFAR